MENTFEDIECFSETCTALGLDESDRKFSSGTPEVLATIASLLETSIWKNEILWRATSRVEDGVVTIFHGSKAPELSIKQYIKRIFKYCNCSTSCFIVSYIYIQRYLQNHSGVCLTSLNIHRLLITSIMIAAKFLDDECDNNAHYALVGGVSTAEMNELEVEFLFRLDFKLQVTVEIFAQYCQYLKQKGSRGGRREYQADHRRSQGHRGRVEINHATRYESRGCRAL